MESGSDALMMRLQTLFDKSGMTLDQLGQKMGYSGPAARKSAWQLLYKPHDHRVSMLQKFAAAVGVSMVDLFADEANKKIRPH
jgi:transcriptional regulator with XRE-family HTH domain